MSSPALSPTTQTITGIVLAGGGSSRMRGVPKALLAWQDARFIDHIIATLQPQVTTLAISANDYTAFTELQLPVLADPFPEARGPLAGMLAGLQFAQTEWTLFTPCDNPQPSPQLAQRLHAAASANAVDIAYARTAGDSHYLYALIRSTLRENLRAYFTQGDFAVHRWYALHTHVAVDFSDQPAHFVNINTPEALQQLRPD